MTSNSSVSEFIIKPKNQGKILFKKIALILAYVFAFLFFLILIIALSPPIFNIMFIIIELVLITIIILATWRFVCIEYEIIIASGELILTAIYGRSFRKRLACIPINSFSEIGIYNDQAYDKLSKMSIQKNYVCLSSLSTPVAYYAIFDEGKDKVVLYFEAPEKAIGILRQQNSGAFRAGNFSKN